MPREETELVENEALWSESDEEDEEEDSEEPEELNSGAERSRRQTMTDDQFKTINRLNTSSHDKLEKLQSPKLRHGQSV